MSIIDILEKIFVFSSLARAKQNLDTVYAQLEEAYDEVKKEGARDIKSRETHIAYKKFKYLENEYKEAINEYNKQKNYSIAVAVVIVVFIVISIGITIYIKHLPEYTSDPFNSEYVQESKKENKEVSKSEESNNDADLPYDVFIPEKESDLIWEPQSHTSGKTIDYNTFIDAYDKAIQSSESQIYCKNADCNYTVVVPFQFEDKGHTFVATRSFFLSENDLGNGRDCFQIYDLNDNVYYYVFNIISHDFDEDGNAILELRIPD